MVKYTVDEKAMLFGAFMSACVAGIGIYQLYVSLAMINPFDYVAGTVVGAMLFNAGVSGLCAIGAMWTNYRAIL